MAKTCCTEQIACLARFSVVAGVCVMLAACAGPIQHELPADYAPGPDDRLGVVIGSVGAIPAPLKPPWYEWSRYDFRSLSDPDLQGFVTSAFDWNPFYMWGSMPLCPDDGLEAECGHAFALLLPAGDYEFHQVIPAMASYASDGSFTRRGWRVPLEGFRFTAEPGRAVYVGNLRSRICIGSRGRGNIVLAAIGRVEDHAARDLPLLTAKYPQLDDMPIESRPVAGSPWLWRYRAGEIDVPYGWPADCALEADTLDAYLRTDP